MSRSPCRTATPTAGTPPSTTARPTRSRPRRATSRWTAPARLADRHRPGLPAAVEREQPKKIAGQPTTFTITPAPDPLPAGCTTAGTKDCQVSGVDHLIWKLDSAPTALDSTSLAVGSPLTLTPTWGLHNLYVAEVDAAGNESQVPTSYSFFVPDAAATAVSLSAPATSGRARALTVTGRLSTPLQGQGSFPSGESVQVSRTDPAHPAGVAVTEARVSTSGAFSFTDTPQTGGANTYTVSYPGTACARRPPAPRRSRSPAPRPP
ncbi:hypothetical protein GXW82_36535 [Streptacidiphilus sp. 4-A2]|nr:hypothetical protein [Streptacidiphilus sp. 4-A2]